MTMDPKNKCDICGRQYKLIPIKTKGLDEWAIGMDTSHVRVRLREQDTTTLLDCDICPHCARGLIYHIHTMKRNAPRKCFFCEFDLGPINPNYPHPNCKNCSEYCNFQAKKRMTQGMKIEYNFYNGDV